MIASIVQKPIPVANYWRVRASSLVMIGRNWKGLMIAGAFAAIAGVSSTQVPAKACVFLHQFNKSSKASDRVSIWERVVYSLIEAHHQTTERRAPVIATSCGAPERA